MGGIIVKTKTTVLKSIAVAGAITAAGTVAATTVHADTANNTVPAKTASVSSATADQQLVNLKSQQAASEAQASSANAATMSAATSDANGQIADLNNQIKQRQASDAAAHQAKITSATKDINSAAQSATDAENASYSAAVAKQSAANDAALKSAEAGILTPAQKQRETAQENASYQKSAANLEDQHAANVNKINSDYQGQESVASQKITAAESAAKTAHNNAVADATKQVDDQIADANKAVNDAQNTINNDQSDVKAKQTAVNQANATVNTAQKTLDSDQADLDNMQKVLKDGHIVVTTNKLSVPQDYINVWKDYYDNTNDWELTQKDYPQLWERNKEASAKAKEMNNDFVASEQDKNTPVHLQADGTLSREDVIIATQYAAELINPIREAIGVKPYEITNASIDMNMENTKKYRAKGHNDWKDSHDTQLLGQIADEWNAGALSESLDGNWSIAENKDHLTVADLKEAVHQAVIDLLFEGADGSSNGHTTDLLGVREHRGSIMLGGSDLLGVDYDLDPVNQNGWIRFNSIGDDKGSRIQNMLKQGYIMKQGTSADKTIQGNEYTHITVPTPDSQSDAAAKLQKQISDLSDKVAKDTNAVKLAKDTVSDAASALKSAQDKLGQDQKTLTDAQSKLNNLKANRDQMIKKLTKDTSDPALIQNLQDQLNTIKSKHADAIKAENADYAAKVQTLKKNHENKLAEIQAQPENVNDLKNQLQGKLGALKKDHEAKLANIQNDAKIKIDALKKQASANDPEIAKLQDQINAIKDNLAKQQKQLDDQFAALKAKDEADYNALEQKLKNSSSEAAKGHNDHYNTGDGHEVVLPGDDTKKTDSGATTPSKPASSATPSANIPASSASSNTNSAASSASTPVLPASSATSSMPASSAIEPVSLADSSTSSLAVSSAVATPVAPESDNQALEAKPSSDYNFASAANDNSVKEVASVDMATNLSASTTHEAVKTQNNSEKLPQTGNESGIVAMILGSMAAMFGLVFAAKKRY